MTKSPLPEIASTEETAECLGISPRRLLQLANDGHIDGKIGRNKFNVVRAIRCYLAYQKGLHA